MVPTKYRYLNIILFCGLKTSLWRTEIYSGCTLFCKIISKLNLINLGPIAYVQQVIVKAMVHPYKKDEMIKADAFRGPLASAFKLHLQDLALFRDLSTNQDMDHLCLRTDGLSDKYRHNYNIAKMLPDYGCLMLSPANLWERDLRSFQMDANVISTVFNFQGKGMFFSHCNFMAC